MIAINVNTHMLERALVYDIQCIIILGLPICYG